MIIIVTNHVLKNKFTKLLFILILTMLLFIILDPMRKLILYKSINVFEDKPLGNYLHDYNNAEEFKISKL